MDRQQLRQRLHFFVLVLIVASLLAVAWLVSTCSRVFPMGRFRRFTNRLCQYMIQHPIATFLVEVALLTAACTALAL